MKRTTLALCLTVLSAGCADNRSSTGSQNDVESAAPVNGLLPGLWSLDSNAMLSNSGFFLHPDGRMETVGFEHIGTWSVKGMDTLELHAAGLTNGSDVAAYKIVTATADRMTLSGQDGERVFRKVPFGLANQEEVLTGYIGTLSSKQPDRIHEAVLPSSKKIGLRLIAADTSLRLELLQDDKCFSPVPAVEWKGILVVGGKFQLRLSSTRPEKLTETGSDYELKILGY